MLKYKHFLLNHNKNEQITKNIMWFNKIRILYALTFLCMKLYILNKQGYNGMLKHQYTPRAARISQPDLVKRPWYAAGKNIFYIG